MIGMEDQKEVLLERVAYTEPMLINDDLWKTMSDVYNSEDVTRQVASAYKI